MEWYIGEISNKKKNRWKRRRKQRWKKTQQTNRNANRHKY